MQAMDPMKSSVFILLTAALLIGVSGCSLFGGGKSNDTPVKLRDALEVPPDLTRPASGELSGVPAGSATYSDFAAKSDKAATTSSSATQVAPATASPTAAAVRLEKDGALQWLLVSDPAEQVWLRLRDYLLKNNYKLAVEDARAGLLETDWQDRPAVIGSGILGTVLSAMHSTGLRDKLRLRVEAGRVAGTSEVYVSHLGLEEVFLSDGSGSSAHQILWQPRPADRQMESDQLAKLMTHFGVDEKLAKDQIVTGGAPRAQLADRKLLLPQDDLEEAWRRVGQVLDRSGVAIEDRNRSSGIYYIRYAAGEKSESSGLFSWLTLGSDKDSRSEESRDRYQVVLQSEGTGSSLVLRDVKGEPDQSKGGEKLLGLLHQQLR